MLPDLSPGHLRHIVAASQGVLESAPDRRLRCLPRPGGRPTALAWGRHPSPLGPLLAAADADGLCWLSFVKDGDGDGPERLTAHWPQARLSENPAATAEAAALAFQPERPLAEPLPLSLYGTPFQLAVWQALLRIPLGALVTYGELAAAVGRPRAVRAAGSAVGANPVSVLVPCHRVIGAAGFPFKYGGGPERKRALLAGELSNHSPSTSAMP